MKESRPDENTIDFVVEKLALEIQEEWSLDNETNENEYLDSLLEIKNGPHGYEHEVFGYLLKPVDFVKFLNTFQKVEKLLVTEFTKQLITTDERFKDFDLSKREIEIIDLIVRNKTAKEITTDLFIAKSTVDKHIANIFKKVNVDSKYELVSQY